MNELCALTLDMHFAPLQYMEFPVCSELSAGLIYNVRVGIDYIICVRVDHIETIDSNRRSSVRFLQVQGGERTTGVDLRKHNSIFCRESSRKTKSRSYRTLNLNAVVDQEASSK